MITRRDEGFRRKPDVPRKVRNGVRLRRKEEDVEFARKHHPADIGSAPVPEEFRSFVAVPEEFRSFVATFRQNVELLIMHDFRVIRQDDKLQYLQDYKRMSRKMMLG